ncbi:MAG: CPBP family intramembrane metalloprotease, partial [Cyanobacteria bacterium]|nr:CPBP family intramembrane metalloprotease [Cyanobacteriota bacterium]
MDLDYKSSNLASNKESSPLSPLLILLMLMPWVWVGLGLFIIKDYRWAIGLYALLGCLFPFLWLRKSDPLMFKFGIVVSKGSLGGENFAEKRELLLLYSGILVFGAVQAVGFWISGKDVVGLIVDRPLLINHLQLIQLNPANDFWGFGMYFVTVNPFVEECFWRGLVQTSFEKTFSLKTSLILTSVLFGSWHWLIAQYFFTPVWAMLTTGLVMIGGVLFGALYARYKTLWPSILIHSLVGDVPIVM